MYLQLIFGLFLSFMAYLMFVEVPKVELWSRGQNVIRGGYIYDDMYVAYNVFMISFLLLVGLSVFKMPGNVLQ